MSRPECYRMANGWRSQISCLVSDIRQPWPCGLREFDEVLLVPLPPIPYPHTCTLTPTLTFTVTSYSDDFSLPVLWLFGHHFTANLDVISRPISTSVLCLFRHALLLIRTSFLCLFGRDFLPIATSISCLFGRQSTAYLDAIFSLFGHRSPAYLDAIFCLFGRDF